MGMKGLATRNKIKLVLRGIKFDEFAEMEDNLIKHVYTPAPLSHIWMKNWHHAQRISEIFRFAAVMSKTPGIYSYFYASAKCMHSYCSAL
jgi:hypothetical protein